MKKPKVILLAKNYENYTSGYYHNDWVKAFRKLTNCFVYGEGYPGYDKKDTINDVIAKSPFSKSEIDLIVCATSWDVDNRTDTVDPHPDIDLSKINDIPKFYFLNKEYKKLDLRFEYIRKNKFDSVGSVLWYKLEEWEEKLGVRFIHTPFGVNLERFKDFKLPKKWDFGFTGSLHKSHTDMRFKVKKELFKESAINQLSTHGLSRLIKGNPLKKKYKKYRIFWAEFGAKGLFFRSLLPAGEKYAKFLNQFKVFLNTPSALGIINTRFYELMATKTLIFCPESRYYGEFLKDGENCIMFKEDMSDFEDKLKITIEESELRRKIVERNSKNIYKFTYENYLKRILKETIL